MTNGISKNEYDSLPVWDRDYMPCLNLVIGQRWQIRKARSLIPVLLEVVYVPESNNLDIRRLVLDFQDSVAHLV
jgi:hypothetical protein